MLPGDWSRGAPKFYDTELISEFPFLTKHFSSFVDSSLKAHCSYSVKFKFVNHLKNITLQVQSSWHSFCSIMFRLNLASSLWHP